MRPRSPTAQPSRVPENETPFKVDPVTLTFDQETAPFTVRSTAPLLPTAQPVSAFAKHTSIRFSPEGRVWRVHTLPPSCVRSTVPLLPTATPASGSMNHTPFNVTLVPLTWAAQVVPASSVWRITPAVPTDQPWRPSARKNTPFKFRAVWLVWTNQPVSG